MSAAEVIDQKRVRVFHQGFQTPRKRWKHDAEGGVLLLFRGVWNPWWKTKRSTKYEARVFFSNATIGNYAVTCFVKWNNKKLCSVKFLPFSVRTRLHAWFICVPAVSEEGAAWFKSRKWFMRKRIKSRKPYSPSTRYKNKYALTFFNNGEELGWRKISILSGGPFRDYNLYQVSKRSTLWIVGKANLSLR